MGHSTAGDANGTVDSNSVDMGSIGSNEESVISTWGMSGCDVSIINKGGGGGGIIVVIIRW